MSGERWNPCIVHRDDAVDGFLVDYFSRPDRKVLLVAGAGFDPRSRIVATRLSGAATSMRALLLQERRPNLPEDQIHRAEKNRKALDAVLVERKVDYQLKSIDIFASDGAVVGGRNVVNFLNNFLNKQDQEVLTDVVVDVSALSAGTSFPIVRYFTEYACRNKEPGRNLHVLVVHNSRLDAGIQSIASDTPSYVHGFKGRRTLFDELDAASLWLPQLASGRRITLQRLYDFIRPHDTCPIVPFPASDPRIGDMLAEEYLTVLGYRVLGADFASVTGRKGADVRGSYG